MADPLAFDPSSYSFDSVAVNGVVAVLIRGMRNSPWFPFINRYTPKVTQWANVIFATATASLMTIKWDVDQGGSGTLIISGITAWSVASFCWLFVKNYFSQRLGVGAMDVYQRIMHEPNVPITVTNPPEKPASPLTILPPPKFTEEI